MIASAGLFGRVDVRWAAGALFIGLFLFLFFMGTWAAPAGMKGVGQAFALGFGGASALTAALFVFTQIAGDLEPAKEAPATTTTTAKSTTTLPCVSLCAPASGDRTGGS